jgi:hypothetical protein
LRGSSKIDFIIRQWEQTGRPILWIAAGANVRQHPLLPQALGCDFAVHKKRSGEMDTGALFFHQTDTARDLLEIWQRLCRSYLDIPEAFLLDQAWALVASQRQIETAWLPDSYWHNGNLGTCDSRVVIQCDPIEAVPSYEENLVVRCHRARRFGRHQAPEPHLIMRGPKQAGRLITVVIRDVLAGDALNTSGAIETIARAFENDPGGFSQMEVVLCAWDEDTESVMRIDDDCWVLVTDPSERLPSDAFAMLARSNAMQCGAAPGRYHINMTVSESAAVSGPVLGARIKRSDRFQRLTNDGTRWN